MLNFKLARPMLVAVVASAVSAFTFNGVVLADDAQDNQALREQMRIMMQRMDELQKQVQSLSKQQAAPEKAAPAPGPAQGPTVAKEKEPSKEPLFDKFIKGFYGTLDVSIDDSTKGMSGLVAHNYAAVA